MKKCKKFLCMAVLALAMTLLMGTTALAATKTITLKSGKVYNQTVQKYGDTYYYKITVPKTGYLTVKGYAYSKYKANTNYSMRMTLCNSKKKPVDSSYGTGSSENRGYKVYYGVKKGTYYLKVTDGAPYKLSYSFKAVTEKSGSKKSKAVALKENKSSRRTADCRRERFESRLVQDRPAEETESDSYLQYQSQQYYLV